VPGWGRDTPRERPGSSPIHAERPSPETGGMDTSTTRRSRAGWTATTVLSTLVGAYAVALVASGFRLVPGDIAANAFPTPWALRTHIVAGGIALLVGPWQFRHDLRARHPRLHRSLGRTYVVACLVGGVSGGAIAVTTTHGPVAATGFLLLAIAWVTTTAVAFGHAVRGRFADHRTWMIRSFALTFAAVTLRAYLGLADAVGIDFETAYPVVAWLCWVPNLVAVRSRERSPR